MGILSKIEKSADLVKGLSDRIGFDIASQIRSDPQSVGPKYRNVVLRCTSCTNQAECAQLQASNDHLDRAPDYCLNRDTFDSGAI
jgi:hypothetical protein